MYVCDCSSAEVAGELGKHTVSLIVGGGRESDNQILEGHRPGPVAREPHVHAC